MTVLGEVAKVFTVITLCIRRVVTDLPHTEPLSLFDIILTVRDIRVV